MDKKDLLLLSQGVLMGSKEINTDAPAISPSFGAELLENGGFTAWTGDNPDSWTVALEDANNYITENPAGKANLVSNNTANVTLSQSEAIGGTLAVGDWVKTQWEQTVTGNYVRARLVNTDAALRNFNGDQTTYGAARCTTNITVQFQKGTSGTTNYVLDNASLKVISFASMHVKMGNIGRKNGTYTCHPTVTDGSKAGILIEYKDANNFVLAMVDRWNGKATLLKRIAGTYTEVITGSITYGAGNELKVSVNGVDHTLYYNSVIVGSTTAISDSGLGTEVHAWNSLAGNQVGLVTTSPVT
ncbi:MAG TPA: hypothetical protein VLA49_06835 [Anaerolineales bacterium]|nr:hypothetical protein [Anaerolineales bacterium]